MKIKRVVSILPVMPPEAVAARAVEIILIIITMIIIIIVAMKRTVEPMIQRRQLRIDLLLVLRHIHHHQSLSLKRVSLIGV
jgi:hypothetical protein